MNERVLGGISRDAQEQLRREYDAKKQLDLRKHVSRSAPEDLQSSLSPSEYLILLLVLAKCDSASASAGASTGGRAESYVSKIAAKKFERDAGTCALLRTSCVRSNLQRN